MRALVSVVGFGIRTISPPRVARRGLHCRLDHVCLVLKLEVRLEAIPRRRITKVIIRGHMTRAVHIRLRRTILRCFHYTESWKTGGKEFKAEAGQSLKPSASSTTLKDGYLEEDGANSQRRRRQIRKSLDISVFRLVWTSLAHTLINLGLMYIGPREREKQNLELFNNRSFPCSALRFAIRALSTINRIMPAIDTDVWLDEGGRCDRYSDCVDHALRLRQGICSQFYLPQRGLG